MKEQPNAPPSPTEQSGRRRRSRHRAGSVLATLDGKPVRILDVSLTGLGFESRDALDLDGMHRLELFTEIGELRVIGRIAWYRVQTSDPESPSYRGGIRFGPLPSNDAKALLRLLERRAVLTHSDPVDEEYTTEFSQDDVAELVKVKLHGSLSG